MAKKKLEKTDGLGPLEIKKLRNAIRQVWQRSHARKLVQLRCKGEDGYQYCEVCKERTPNFKVDHIVNCGDVDEGYIKRMFVPSSQLQGMCHECHKFKTKSERASKPKKSKKARSHP